jgi:hypothetical protein
MLLVTLKRQDFVLIFLLKNCAKYCLDLEQKLAEIGTGNETVTAINQYGSTTLEEKEDFCYCIPGSWERMSEVDELYELFHRRPRGHQQGT